MAAEPPEADPERCLASDEGEGLLPPGPRAPGPGKPCLRVASVGAVLGVVAAVVALCERGGAQSHGRAEPERSHLAAVPILAAARPSHNSISGRPVVEAIFTFGAPGVARPALVNLLAEDSCFQGLRSYTEDIAGPITKQVDAAAISDPYEHAKIATAVLHSGGDSTFVPCPGATDWPSDRMGTEFADWNLHWQDDYEPRLRALTLEGQPRWNEEPFRSAVLSVLLSFKTYDSTNHTKDAIRERFPTWSLVAKETLVSGSGALYDEDPVMLFQESLTLDCMFTIAGINYGNEVARALKVQLDEFCGFPGVHSGYRDQLRQLAGVLWPRLQPKLAQCRTVSCAGHSMGGALCELFAACINSQRTNNSDYKQLNWTPATPAPLPEISEGGNVYLPGAERRCPRPPCPK